MCWTRFTHKNPLFVHGCIDLPPLSAGHYNLRHRLYNSAKNISTEHFDFGSLCRSPLYHNENDVRTEKLIWCWRSGVLITFRKAFPIFVLGLLGFLIVICKSGMRVWLENFGVYDWLHDPLWRHGWNSQGTGWSQSQAGTFGCCHHVSYCAVCAVGASGCFFCNRTWSNMSEQDSSRVNTNEQYHVRARTSSILTEVGRHLVDRLIN